MVPRKAGWDTHGLPVELEVEKMLGLNGKEQIEEYGIEPFIEKCKESVWKYKGMWEDFSGTVGFWADMDNPYVTYDDNFIESEWWALNQIWNKGLLYKGFKIVPYCPRCGTPLSDSVCSQTVYLLLTKWVGQERTFSSLPIITCLSNSATKSCQSCCQSSVSKNRVCSADGLNSILITEFFIGRKRDKVS